MRALILSCNVTVDGFMAAPGDGRIDFVVADAALEGELAARFRADAGGIVVGRRTFLEMAAYWSTADGDMAAWLNTTPKFVLSEDHDLDVSGWANSALIAGDGVDRVRELKASAGPALVTFGGVQTLRALVAAGLVDEYWFKVSPIALGRGRSMFSSLTDRRSLTLRTARSFPSGIIDAVYTA